MKTITEYLINNHIKKHITVSPTDPADLIDIVRKRIAKDPAADLNDIDVSKIQTLDNLFMRDLFHGKDIKYTFDVSEWDVSNALSMQSIFRNIDYEGDLSNWDVSGVLDFDHAFADSKIDSDVSSWKINSKANTKSMFARTAIQEKYLPQGI